MNFCNLVILILSGKILKPCNTYMGASSLCIALSALFYQGETYENVAFNKSTWQQYPYHGRPWGASRAVDGLYSDLSALGGQCVISANERNTAEWRVDLGRIHIIHHMVIHYRTEHLVSDITNVYASRFLGFSVYISNTTDKEDGILCFKDNNYTIETIPNPMNITCPNQESGRYVIYYNSRTHPPYPDGYSTYAYNEICEMEVLSCPYGFYGKNCADKCNATCNGCNDVNGSCDSGCIPGWIGNYCNEACSAGLYGLDCNQTCGNCLGLDNCSHTDGVCLTGCDVGYQGELCKTPCDRGLYGYECREDCGRCRELNQCFHITGECLTGCEAGYEGPKCNESCQQGYFGENCSYKCIDTCDGCNNVNGLCDSGCLPGWKGCFCSERYGCPDIGYYGSNCTIPCPDVNCRECHIESGTCQVCKHGYKGHRCETEFEDKMNVIKFYSLLGAFCLSLAVIGILTSYNIMIRRRQLKKNQPNEPQGSRSSDLPDTSRGGVNCERYLEFMEMRSSEIYQNI